MRILVRRTGALGDVVLATPVVRRLKREHPDAEIMVQTAYPDVFRGNPHIRLTLESTEWVPYEGTMSGNRFKFDSIINLDLAYERRPNMHIVEAYMEEVFGSSEGCDDADMRQEIFFDRAPIGSVAGKGFVAVHAAVAGWRNRTLPRDTWKEVLHRLVVAGLRPVLVGMERDGIDGVDCPRFLAPDIHAQARLIQSCECFVGSDSGLLHVAGATDTPIVGVFTSARPEYRLPFRENCVAIVPPGLGCLGCMERQPAPSTTESCERGDIACVGAVRAEDVAMAVVRMVNR